MSAIRDVLVVSVPVSDQERAKRFYVDQLGFELRADNAWGEGMRWIEVAPEGGTTSMTLVTWFGSMPPGSLNGVVLEVDDVLTAYKELSARGVDFEGPPEEQPWGIQAVFRDPDGNGFVLSRASD
ncbi:MAG: glyoxalase superfamily protein [Chloroflexota bacterium]|nr:glyoxalase superfamily protein [Chloroflexota bacterium]